ncbi:MAG: C10 family peptidase [Bacteroidales bacterium]|nr:C10 family peptidase [Bacteroidales bacterium]
MKIQFKSFLKLVLLIFILIDITSCEKLDFSNEILANNEIVNIDDAKIIAEIITFPNNYYLKNGKEKKEIKEIKVIKNKEEPYFYIMNYKDGKGFIVLSADKRCMPILAFSHEGSFNIENITGGLADWIEESKFYVKSMKADTSKKIFFNKKLWDGITGITAPPVGDDPVPNPEDPPAPITTTKGPLLSTIWCQGCGFNDQCPYNVNGPCYRARAGCITIAMAQIMNYHEYPTYYDWDAMPDGGYSDELAAFIREIGDAIDINWGSSSGLQPDVEEERVPSTLKNTFGYSQYLKFIDYNGNHDKVINELNHYRPVYMRGGWKDYWLGLFSYYGGGHAWVCDGYLRNIYPNGCSYLHLHMNWGWNYGESNGWFAFNNFNPPLGDEQYSFNYKRGCIIGIQP